MTPHKCPVCEGTGKVSRPPWVAGDVYEWVSSSSCGPYTCSACNGTGLVWSNDNEAMLEGFDAALEKVEKPKEDR